MPCATELVRTEYAVLLGRAPLRLMSHGGPRAHDADVAQGPQ